MKNRRRGAVHLASCLALAAKLTTAAHAASVAGLTIPANGVGTPATLAPDAPGGVGKVPTGKGWGVYRPGAPGVVAPRGAVLASGGNGILYHGGPVMLGTTNLYFIWYGSWGGNTAPAIMKDWANSIGGTPYFAINTTYTDGGGQPVGNSVHFGGALFNSYSQGSSIDDNMVFAIVQAAIAGGSLPLDSHGVYYVLTSADVSEVTGFCSLYCGWHSNGTISGTDVKFAFVGNPARCPGSCEGFPGSAPNGNAGADGMVSIITHELDESVTDPDGNAWYDSNGNEVGDKCNFDYGGTYTTVNGSAANVRFGARDFLVQRDWINANGGACAIAYGSRFYTVPPCRLIDTRDPAGPAGGPALQPGSPRTFALAGRCGIPATAGALSVMVTVTQPAGAGSLTLFAADQPAPPTSVISFDSGQTRANIAVLALSGDGTGSVTAVDAAAGAVHFILDVNGYFQ
ncbi:MAG TPA: hypothetical protein VHR45_08395 [Thermoanaerobaculia bacterium]|nr:hypothetical protein [Thermoanaerobaculia bacterium]